VGDVPDISGRQVHARGGAIRNAKDIVCKFTSRHQYVAIRQRDVTRDAM
jgi:hypothetical protein